MCVLPSLGVVGLKIRYWALERGMLVSAVSVGSAEAEGIGGLEVAIDCRRRERASGVGGEVDVDVESAIVILWSEASSRHGCRVPAPDWDVFWPDLEKVQGGSLFRRGGGTRFFGIVRLAAASPTTLCTTITYRKSTVTATQYQKPVDLELLRIRTRDHLASREIHNTAWMYVPDAWEGNSTRG